MAIDPKNYTESVYKQMLYYKALAEKAMEQISEEQLFVSYNDNSNSIALIIKHLAGNMLSRWTDFLTSDGEKEWRNRDAEFENDINSKEAVMALWNKGWNVFLDTLKSLKPDDLSKIVYIRNQGHTVVDAINRQLAHYPYHVGQIVFCAKLLKETEWNSLSIPKNRSKDYNAEKFSEEKRIKHFTDDELKNLK
ncbi:DUF1572 domain-containing protein [Flavobacterium sp. NRK F10]|uniref:DUF1572 domain-containing protein n=1 Tax=Flavobacterium sediminis TaxID=2201181 RepID=A0A2U8QWB1_9FLAO|nr:MULTISPECIES: DUF1572 family protein [Flavobacterium]AWM14490.1 hypothetical protein DI487_11905 [Flavobacterium sediminis]MCO6175720.1 DUF1572 domain-containing protein [Flavobacterium sp. NRK F10]